jgi:hypothetical protein
VLLRTGDPRGALAAAEAADRGWDAGDPYMPGTWAQIRIGAAIAHLQQKSLDGTAEQVSPMLKLAPEFRISTVTGYLAVLDGRLARPRFATSRTAHDLRQEIRDFQTAAPAATRWGDQMTLPTQMTDRWHDRHTDGPDEGTVYWHMLMGDQPGVTSIAQQAQQRLAPFAADLHMTPHQWLHMTTLAAGPATSFPVSSSGK